MMLDGRLRGALAACLIGAVATAAPAFAQQQQQAPAGQAPSTIINIYPPGTTPPAPGAAPRGQAPVATGGGASVPPQAAAPPSQGAAGAVKEATGRVTGPNNAGTAQVTAQVISLTREANSLFLRLRLVNNSNTDAGDVWMHSALLDSYIVDPVGQRRAGVIKDGAGGALATDQYSSGVPAGETNEVFIQYPQPPANVSSVNLYLKGFPPIMGVPIAPAGQSSAPANGPREATGRITGSNNAGTARVTARVISLTREANTLMLRLSMVNDSTTDAGDVWTHSALTDAYIVEPSAQRRAGVIRDGQMQALATDQYSSGVPAGETRELFAQFPQLPGNATSVNLYIPGFPPIMNVPIS